MEVNIIQEENCTTPKSNFIHFTGTLAYKNWKKNLKTLKNKRNKLQKWAIIA